MKANATTIMGLAVVLCVLAVGGLFVLGVFDSGPAAKPLVLDDGGGVKVAESDDPEISPSSAIEVKKFDKPKANGSVEIDRLGPKSERVVRGLIKDPNERPLAMARVELFRDVSQIRNRPQEGERIKGVITDGTGAYSFSGLIKDERYVLKVSHDNFTTERRSPIDPQDESTLTHVVTLQTGVGFEGTVTDAEGRPLSGASIFAYDINVQSIDPEGQLEKLVETDASGNYALRNVTLGTKKVVARKPGFSSDGRSNLDLKDRDPGSPLKVNFVLNEGFKIRGVVKDEQTGRPIEGVIITARPQTPIGRSLGRPNQVEPGETGAMVDGATIGTAQRPHQRSNISRKAFLLETAKSDANGEFVLEGLMEARYQIMARMQGYQPHNAVQHDAGSDGVVIELVPSASVSGRVIDMETGNPIPYFAIAASPSPTLTYIPASVKQRFENKDGQFKYIDVRPGSTYLLIEAEGYAMARTDSIVVQAGREVSDILVKMGRGATLKGRVVTNAGLGVKGAEVLLQANDVAAQGPANIFNQLLQGQLRGSERTVRTDADGNYVMPAVATGDYRLKVTHPDFASSESELISAPDRGEVAVGDVRLNAGGLIKGRVLDFDGNPDDKATVMVTSANPQVLFYSRSYQTDANGEFQAAGLSSGTYRVVVTQRNGLFDLMGVFTARNSTENMITIGEGDTQEIRLQAPAAPATPTPNPFTPPGQGK